MCIAAGSNWVKPCPGETLRVEQAAALQAKHRRSNVFLRNAEWRAQQHVLAGRELSVLEMCNASVAEVEKATA